MASGKSKRIIWVVFFSLVVLSSFSYGDVQYKSRLWKIKSLQQTSYLLGTMHVSDEDVVRIPARLDSVIRSTSTLALELKLDVVNMMHVQQAFELARGQTLRSIIGADLYAQVISALRDRGYGLVDLNRFKPWAASLLLNYPPPGEAVVLDKKLNDLYMLEGKRVIGLETPGEQMSVFEKMTIDEQIGFLTASLKQVPEIDAAMRTMKRFYLEGDLSGLLAFSELQSANLAYDGAEKLMAALIDVRNEKMVERMKPVLSRGEALIAVGALHLPGEKGVIALLRQRGYQVTPIFLD
ncbi:hypothetical protein A9Q99_01130 [Gammaproteobacteria bacterium 45_16_T64]|nr:hypothetical protein A9Q99_01130 [Gammaproteobacteria bacterium 45_16_T64]